MRIAIDNVIFQIQVGNPRGISRVWENILPYMTKMLESKHKLILLERMESRKIEFGIKNRQELPQYSELVQNQDMGMLTSICKNLGIDLFITTYHTKVTGIKNLVMVHDLIPEKRNWLKPLNEYTSRSNAYQNAQILICVSENTKKELHEWYRGININKIHVVLEGVNPKEFHPFTSNEISQFLEDYKLKSGYLVLDGDISEVIAENFCQAFSSLNTGLALFSYGGVLDAIVTKTCQKYKIKYIDAGWLSKKKVPLALAGAKGLIFISNGEGFGLPVLEAMACRIPVICSHIDSLPEVGGDAVQYFTDHSFESIKSGLSSFIKDENRNQLAKKGFERSKSFTWEKMAEKIVRIILK